MKRSVAQAVMSMIDQLERRKINLHGLIVRHEGKRIAEGYYWPYRSEMPHRVFSVSKSVTALAVGILLTDGSVQLSDRIVDYFPDKLPRSVPEKTCAMTIENLLCMATCHDRTTYDSSVDTDWVRTFFEKTPCHWPGTVFSYDTSSSHVLAAMVQRVTGRSMLDFLQERLFQPLGLIGEMRWRKDPHGICEGGTGLSMTLPDMSALAEFCMSDGQGIIREDYMKRMTGARIATVLQPVAEHRFGYGYQVWRNRNGFTLFGMGGQLAICIPEKRISVCTFADLRLDEAGLQCIYDACFAQLLGMDGSIDDPAGQRLLDERMTKLRCVSVNSGKAVQHQHFGRYALEKNSNGFAAVTLTKNRWTLHGKKETIEIAYGLKEAKVAHFSRKQTPYAASGAWLDNHTFYLRCNLYGEVPCGFDALMAFREGKAVMRLARSADVLTDGLEGDFSAKRMGVAKKAM